MGDFEGDSENDSESDSGPKIAILVTAILHVSLTITLSAFVPKVSGTTFFLFGYGARTCLGIPWMAKKPRL